MLPQGTGNKDMIGSFFTHASMSYLFLRLIYCIPHLITSPHPPKAGPFGPT